jgi:hypothetical protein
MFSSPNLVHRKSSTPTLRWLPVWRAILGLILLATAARAGEPVSPARELLKLIPSDASVVLRVDDLRGQVHELLTWSLVAEFQKLPAVKAWFDSEKYKQFETARDQIEGLLQAKLTEVRDQILGDAVVVALCLPPDLPFDPSRARGILALKAANPALLKRLIGLVNTTQKKNGELAAVVERRRGVTSYFVREFPAGSDHLPEAYVTFPDGTFAVSNFAGLIADFIDRKTGKADHGALAPASLAGLPRFQTLEHKLPTRTIARMCIDPRLVENLVKNSKPRSPGEALILRYVGALESAGAALVVREGHLALHTALVFEPRKFRDLTGSGTARSTPTVPRIDHLPATTLAVGSLQVDFAALYKLFLQTVPESERHRLENAEIALKGVFLGQDPRTRILPALGPRILAFVNAPADWEQGRKPGRAPLRDWPFSSVIALELQADADRNPSASSAASNPRVADVLDNALNTLLALVTFNGNLAETRARIVTHEVAGVTVKTLDPPVGFAYAVDRSGHRLVLGDSAGGVERFLASGSEWSAGDRFRRLQARAFPEAHSFLCIDVAAVANAIATHRDGIIGMLANREHRSRDEVAHDMDQFLALSRLFDAAYLSNSIDSDSATVFHAVGLLARQSDAARTSSPIP